MDDLEFQECDTCAAKPGQPPLCSACLHNRRVIGILVDRLEVMAVHIKAARALAWLLTRESEAAKTTLDGDG